MSDLSRPRCDDIKAALVKNKGAVGIYLFFYSTYIINLFSLLLSFIHSCFRLCRRYLKSFNKQCSKLLYIFILNFLKSTFLINQLLGIIEEWMYYKSGILSHAENPYW